MAQTGAERQRAYYQRNREKVAAYERERRERDSEKIALRNHEWYMRNRERVLAEHRERHRAKKKSDG